MNNNNNNNQLLDKLKQQQTSGGGGDDLLSSLVFNAQNDAKRIYKAKNEILPVYKFKRWFKPSKKQLQSITNSVIYTNGSDKLTEDVSSSKMTPHYYSVPWLGVDKKNLEYSETVMIDIDSDSTTLPVFCKILIVHQGAVHVRSPALLLRDVSIQVGNDDILFNNNNSNTNDQQQQLQTKNKRSSWALADEYYSTPFYQHSGKSTGSKYNQDTQVTENEFLSYSSQQTSTDDLISHLRLHIHSKTDIMSEFSLSKLNNNNNNDNTTENTNRISSNNIKSEKRFRRLSTNNEKQNNVNFKINQNNIKRYENVCSLTGIRRLTLIMPPTSNFVDFDNNIVREIDYLKPLLKFEEYNVVDSSVDTSDLNKYIQSDNYTYIQLLSENALIGKGVQKISNNINNNNTENLITTNTGGKKSAISSSSSSSILKSTTQLTQPKKKLVTINHNKSIQQTKSNNIATQTDLFKKINETKEKHQQHFPIINNDHNYDITDILERYNLKKLATDSSLVNNSSNETQLLAPSLTPFIPHTKIPISPSSSNNNKEDLSIDLTQINLTDQSNQHLSSSHSFNQSNRSHRSSSSHNNNNNNKELINDTNDYYYCYYNANNSRYPLISKAVSNNHHHHQLNQQQQRYDENLVVNEKLRSKSSKPVLMRGRSFRIIPTRNDLHHSTTPTAAAVLEQQQSKYRTSRRHEEKMNKLVSNDTNEENKYCSNCNRKQENRKEERLPTTATTREKEIILKLDKTKVNDIEFVENSPKIDRIVFIPAVLASRSEHTNYYHDQNNNNNNHNHNHIDTNINGTNNSRYRRSKYDRSLYMYSTQKPPIKGYYVSSSSTDSDDTAIIDLTRRFKIAHNIDDNYDDHNQLVNDKFIDQLII